MGNRLANIIPAAHFNFKCKVSLRKRRRVFQDICARQAYLTRNGRGFLSHRNPFVSVRRIQSAAALSIFGSDEAEREVGLLVSDERARLEGLSSNGHIQA